MGSKNKVSLFDFLNYLFLAAFCISITYPFWRTLLLSLANEESATTVGLYFWNTKGWSINSYLFAFSSVGNIQVAYLNTIVKTIISTVLTVIVTIFAAYPLSKKNLPGRGIFTAYFVFSMFFAGGIIPSYLLIRNLGLINSLWALILPTLCSAYYIVICRNFLMSLDKGLEESAMLDGAGYMRILFQIILPISKPIIATIVLWTMVAHWNSWFDALMYINEESKTVLQIFLRRLVRPEGFSSAFESQSFSIAEGNGVFIPTETIKAAVVMLTIGPIILVYPFLQKYFNKGIMIGSLKG